MRKTAAFEVGSVVELKSGSAKMCVRSVDGDQVTVDWFDGEKAKTKTFSAAQLQPSLWEASEASDPRISRLKKWLGLDEFADRKFDSLIERALNQKPKTES